MAAGSSAAAAAGAAATVAANAARKEACNASVKGYTHDGATVAEMRVYADCVNRLHPGDGAATLVFGALVVVIALIALWTVIRA